MVNALLTFFRLIQLIAIKGILQKRKRPFPYCPFFFSPDVELKIATNIN